MDNLVIEISNYPPINNAKIELNKINVVGGINGSGKSTISKIIYSFLKGNSTKRRDYALQYILDDINGIIDVLNYEGNDYNLPNHLSIKDNNSYILKKYNELIEINKKHSELSKVKLVEINKEMNRIIDNLIEMLVDCYCNKKELTTIYDSEKKTFEQDEEYYLLFPENIFEEVKEHRNIYAWLIVFNSFKAIMEKYEVIDNIDFWHDLLLTKEMRDLSNEIHKLWNLEEQWDYFIDFTDFNFVSNYNIINFDLPRKIDILFAEDSPAINRIAVEGILSKEYVTSSHDVLFFHPKQEFMFHINSNGTKIDAFDYFFNNFIDTAYYVDNVSLIDLWNPKHRSKNNLFHVEELLEDLFDFKRYDLNKDVNIILEKIENIIKGTFENWYPSFSTGYDKEKSNHVYEKHISSGIKQIGIIQLLLLNNKLKKDGYLIIDEPEVNLHPEWQFKFAEILVLLVKYLNITIYLNSHSPFFIEALDAFIELYDMQEDVNYYLTEESENEGKFNLTKIESNELYKIYDSLGKPYDLIDQIRLRKHLGE